MKTQLSHPSKWLFIPVLLGLFFLISFCSNEKTRQSVNDFNAWVKEHKDSVNKYIDREWADLDKEFVMKKEELDKDMDRMDKSVKTAYLRTLKDWEDFKADYLVARESKLNSERKALLNSTLVKEGIHNDFSNLTPLNIAGEYEHFVNTVNQKKDDYTMEEWLFIDKRWKELNAIRDRMDERHSINAKDNQKISGLKIEYTGIKALNKPFAEKE